MLRATDSSSTGGIITLQAGHGAGGSFAGRIDIRAGNNTSNGPGGDVNLFGGRGTNVGGDVYLEGGTQSGSFGLAGDIILVGGNAGASGALGGRILLIPGLDFAGGYRPVTIIEDAALFLSGDAGNIILQSSVIASGFFGVSATLDGGAQIGLGPGRSTFTVNPGGAVFALQLSSGISISNGGPIELTNGGYIRFADGTVSTTAATGAPTGSVAASTCVYPSPTASIPVNATPNVFIATATLTISQNSRIRMWAFGNHGGNTTSSATTFWANNSVPAGFGNPSCVTTPATASTLGAHHCDRMTEPLAAGTYNLGWAAAMNSGSADAFYNGYGSFQPFFCAMEVKTQ